MASKGGAPQSATIRGSIVSAAAVSKQEARFWTDSSLDLSAYARSAGLRQPKGQAGRRDVLPINGNQLSLPNSRPSTSVSGNGSDTESTCATPRSTRPRVGRQTSAHDLDICNLTNHPATKAGVAASTSMPDLHSDNVPRKCSAMVRLAPLNKSGKGRRTSRDVRPSGRRSSTAAFHRESDRRQLSRTAPLRPSFASGGVTPVSCSRKFMDFASDPDSRRVWALATKYRLPVAEVQRIADAVDALKRSDELGQVSEEEFRRCLCASLDVTELSEELWQNALTAFSCKGSITLKDVVDWYVQNMFTHAKAQSASDALVCELARKFSTKTNAIEKIKVEFDRFDKDGDGSISRDEFGRMLCSIFHAGAGAFSESRSTHYWKEIDVDSDGSINFSEFCRWHLKYFNPNGLSCNLLDSFYDSYKPDVQRRNCLRKCAAPEVSCGN